MSDRRPGALSPEQVKSVIDALERMGPDSSTPPPSHADPWSLAALDRARAAPQTKEEATGAHRAFARDNTEERLAAWEARRAESQQRRVAEAREAETKECTFRPAIHRLPGGPQRKSEPFPDRLARMAKASAERKERLIRESEAATAGECTFTPEIHASPIAASSGAADDSVPVDSRWADEAVDDDGFDEDGVKVFEYVPVEERMTQARLHALLGSDWHQRDDPECTFRPVISATAEQMHETSRCHDASKSVYVRLYEHSTACIAGSAPRGSAARERSPTSGDLAPALPSEHARELLLLRRRFGCTTSEADSMPTFLQNVIGTDSPEPFAAVLNHTSEDGISSPRSSGAGSDEAARRYVRFNDFIERQNRLEARRRAAIERVRREVEGPFHPPICERSRALALKAREKGHDTSRSARRPVADDTPTFKPSVSAKSARKPGRDAAAMHGDAEAIKLRKAQLRAQKEQAEARSLSFRPQVNVPPKAYKRVESVLSHRNLPNLMNRLATAESQRAQARAAAQKQKEDHEHAACTFHPKLNVVPSYVADMARSSHVLRGAFETV